MLICYIYGYNYNNVRRTAASLVRTHGRFRLIVHVYLIQAFGARPPLPKPHCLKVLIKSRFPRLSRGPWTTTVGSPDPSP